MRTFLIVISVIMVLPLLLGASGEGSSDVFALAVKLFNSGQYDQALQELSKAVEQKPDDAARRLTYGVALANSRKYDESIVQFQEAASLAPNDPTANFLLEGSYQGIGRVNDAQQSRFAAEKKLKAQAGTKSDGHSTGVGREESARVSGSKLLERAISEYPENAITHNLLGDILQVQGRFNDAAAHYRQATELAPKWIKPWFNLGMANLVVDPAEAIANFKRVSQLDPNNLQAQLWLGDAYAEQRRYSEALQAYSNAAKSPALEPEARARIGNVYLKQNQLDQAEQEFRFAVKSAPQSPAANAGLGDVYQRQQKLDDSAKQYQRAADLTQQFPTQQAIMNYNLANVYIEKGDFEKAIAELKRIVAQSSSRQKPIDILVDTYQRCGQLSKGISEYEAALKKNPGDTTAMRFLLAAYAVSGDQTGRVTMAEKLLKYHPEESCLWYRELGAARAAEGSRNAALDAWRKGLRVTPESDESGILTAASAAGLLDDLTKSFEAESSTSKAATPSLVLADIYAKSGNWVKAAEVRRRLVDLYPDNQQYWIWLGDALSRAGDAEGAENAYRKASLMNGDATLRAIAMDRLKQK